LILVHRYLGIAVGLVMVMWCLSGIVMMYVPYPQLTEANRLAHLSPIDWGRCCRFGESAVPRDAPGNAMQLEMLGASPILRWRDAARRTHLLDVTTGKSLSIISDAQARSVAQAYSEARTAPLLLGRIDHDQWTVQGAGGADRPLFHFSLQDAAGTEVYVSSVTGKAQQLTTSRERFWSWLGAVPHWLYFSTLRQNPGLWSSVVVWTSTVGCFLTLAGVYIGIRQFRPRAYGGWLPYRGLQYWHHLLGLIFGLFVLTWVASGLASMNPWGFLEDEPPLAESSRLRGLPPPLAQLETGWEALGHTPEIHAAVSVDAAPLGGQLFFVATDAAGERVRTDSHGQPAALDSVHLESIAAQLANGHEVLSKTLLNAEDLYYFSHHREYAALPVYRVIVDDAQRTRYYLDPVSGAIRARIDRDARWYRWLHPALHRLDFNAAFRASIARDFVMITLLVGMTAVCGIGTYLGFLGLWRANRRRRPMA
jgi:uncharacterized iron-regulated membrane protein